MTMQSYNEVVLEGLVQDAPTWSHENHGTAFYRFFLEVDRLSGQADVLPILVTDGQKSMIEPGESVRIRGELRSFNNRSGVGNRLVLTVYAREILPPEGKPYNKIRLSGSLCKPPVFRRTPLGRSICDLMLAVPRRYGRADYLPVIAWGQLAVQLRSSQVGDGLDLVGRFQSRAYQKVTEEGTQDRVAYEVSVMELT